MTPEPSFEIPQSPKRRYSRHAGLEYRGKTVFSLEPEFDCSDTELDELVRDILDGAPYTYGDWFDLPMALYLVNDAETGDVFRVAVRNQRIEFHVLPGTNSVGLRALYRRVCDASGCGWDVECRTDE